MKEEAKRKEEEAVEEEHILRFKSDVPLPPIPNMNFAAFMIQTLAQHGGKKALMDASTGKHHTYSDVCAIVPRVCAGLVEAGVGAGEAVLLISPNHIDFLIANLAIMLCPAVCVPVSPALSPEEVAHVVRMSGARWAVVEEGVAGVLDQLPSLLPPDTLKGVWVMGASSHHPSFASLMRTEVQNNNNNNKSDSFDAGSTVAHMPFSSGTTGLPKGVMLSHRSLLTIYHQNKYLSDLSGEEGHARRNAVMARVLLVLPLYHMYGLITYTTTALAGGCLIVMGRFSLRSFLQAVQKYKATYTPLVPHLAKRLVDSPLVHEFDVSSLLYLGSGSAPIPPATQEAIMEKVGPPLGNGYGLTETCAPVASSNPRVGFKPGAVGPVLPYVELKVVDLETRKTLGVGEEGEVWVRGPGLMLGYTPPPGAAPGPPLGLEAGGWLATGDLGRVDEDGFLFITDRIKDLIKVKGFQVCPSELEAVLRGVEGVGDVAVLGVPSPRLGEAPRAYVVPSPGGRAPSPRALEDYVAARVAPFKRLAGGVEVVESLPKNAIGKVLRRRLRDDYLKKMKEAEDAGGATGATVPNSKL